ncbi:MAG: hypothetical protein WBD95_13390 [Xanthobacteraceae bacterium]
MPATLAQLDAAVAAVRENLRELAEQAAAFSCGEDEALMADRIREQEDLLATLMKERDVLTGRAS